MDHPAGSGPISERSSSDGGRVVYVVPSDSLLSDGSKDVDLLGLWNTLWLGRWVIIGCTTAIAIFSVAYALLATQWYSADVLLAPADSKSATGLADSLSSLGGLGSLAGLAGVTIGGGSTAEPLAVLTSRDFTRAFIEEQKLLPVLFADKWSASTGRWKAADRGDWPDMHDAIKYFDEDIRRVQEDKRTRLVTLTIQWTDPKVAADWANLLVKRLNERMRQRALHEAESNVTYLKQELGAADVITLQQSIGRLLEGELQKAMLARVSEEFAFRVIDRAEAPKWRSWPKRTQLVLVALVAGALLSSLFVLVRQAVRRTRGSGDDGAASGSSSLNV